MLRNDLSFVFPCWAVGFLCWAVGFIASVVKFVDWPEKQHIENIALSGSSTLRFRLVAFYLITLKNHGRRRLV